MVFPEHTITGKKWRKEWLEIQVKEIEDDGKHSPHLYPDWLPMYRELMEYAFTLEERLTKLEENSEE